MAKTGRLSPFLMPRAWLLASVISAACAPPSSEPSPAAAVKPPPMFTEQAAASGLDFVHFNGMSGELYYSEMMGSGVALLDYDGDGDLDVYLVQGAMLGAGKSPQDALLPPSASMLPLRDRLYRNELAASVAGGSRRLRFTDVTASSGIDARGYGMGVAVGDIDNDGWSDLYVTNAGPNQMWRNNGDGTFTDVTAETGTEEPRWSASATFVDVDRDGWLDLYVVNYVDFTVEGHRLCRSLTGAPDYCGPLTYRPLRDRLFRNRGDGTFEDRSSLANVLGELGAGLGVAAGDFDDDGWPDLYVANDGMPNFLWMNRGDGTFENQAFAAGCALNREGRAEAGMGVAVGDVDGDGDEDVLVTHLALETNTLYRNQGRALFEDASIDSALGPPSWPYTGFGTALADVDNDGWLDVLAVNGGVKIAPELADRGDPHPLGMPNQLFRNLGSGRFEDSSARGGSAFSALEVSRGLATGDIDNDGDVDVVVTNNGGPARLLINEVGRERHWVGLRLVTGQGRRDALGAWVGVHRGEAPVLWRRVRTDGSYLSASDPRLLIGLGASPGVDAVEVRWPSGRREVFEVAAGRYTTLEEGAGSPRRSSVP
ncbi:MAG TPA: CRTAC1 family protein [Thermoanaerobaculia bacterium]|nr:CRTAC1 family protein [Thermoanaerobaculia bacterium]